MKQKKQTSNKKQFNFNTFNKPLNFISAIYNGEISLKEAEIKQRDLDKKKRIQETIKIRQKKKRKKK